MLVAQDRTTKEFLCNNCIFNTGNTNLVFLSQLGKEIQTEYNRSHLLLEEKYKQLARVTPDNIDKTTREQWKKMTEGVKVKIKGMANQIMELMRQNVKILELEKVLNEVRD